MAQRRLLYLDAAGLSAFAWERGQVLPLAQFAPGEEGQGHFARFLAAQPRGSVYHLLVDLVEEAFQFETLPHVRGSDRSAMLARKRSQHLMGSPYATEISLGREAAGRRDERLLFTGLTRPAALEPWLEALARAEAPLAGIHTLPLLADSLPAPFGQPEPPARLVMVFTPAGIRQIFLERGRLRFSRLSTRLDTSLGGLAATLAEEAGRTQAYLTSQRLLPRSEALPVTVLANPEEAKLLAARVSPSPQWTLAFADLEALAQRVGLHSPCPGSDALPLFLHWMVRQPGRRQLAPPAAQRFHRLRQARLTAYGVGTAAFLACLVGAAKLGVDTLELERDIERVSLQTRADAGRYQALLATLPPLPAPLETLQDLMARIDRQAAAPADLRPALAILARALDQTPDLNLESLTWRAGAPAGTGNGPQPAAVPERVELEARLRFPAGVREDRRALVSQSEALASLLRHDPAVTVQITRMPVDLDSDRTLRGGGMAPSGEGPFLEIRLSLPGGARP